MRRIIGMQKGCSRNDPGYSEGRRDALIDIKKQIDFAASQGYKFPILHLLDYIDKELGLK
jgi:hypothetical protein